MNIKELKEKIKDLPDNMDVMVEQTNEESRFGMANAACVMPVTFQDDEDSEDDATIDCFVITDDV